MHCFASSAKDTANATLEQRQWDAAVQFRANSGPKGYVGASADQRP